MDKYPEDFQPDPLYQCAGCLEPFGRTEIHDADGFQYCPSGHVIVGKVDPFIASSGSDLIDRIIAQHKALTRPAKSQPRTSAPQTEPKAT